MDLLLQRYQSVIHHLRKTEPTRNVTEFLDEVVAFLNNPTNNQSDGYHILTVICHELAGFSTLKLFNNPEIMNHQFLIILSNTFRMLLTKVTFTSLTKQDEQCFDGISLLISNLCSNNNKISTSFYTDNNEKLNPENVEKFNFLSYEKIFFTELFMKKFARVLDDNIAVNNYEPWDVKYKVVDRLLRLCIKLNDIDQKLILDSVVKCVKSKIYINLYETIDLRQPILTPKQTFFMYRCPRFIRLCSDKRQDEISNSLSRTMMKYSTDIFEKNLPIVLEGELVLSKNEKPKKKTFKEKQQEEKGAKTQAIAWHIEFLNHFTLSSSTRVFFLEGRDGGKTVIDQMIEILKTESLIKSVEVNTELFHADVALVSYSITLLYNLTFEKKIFYDLKLKNVINICENLFGAKDKTIQFAARTLSAILIKEDIDEMDSPTKVARYYLYFIENTIDDLTLTYHGIKLDGVLTNLEDIVQNDEVKEEITNDDEGIRLIGRCSYEPHLDVETIQSRALRIIDAISFANESAIEQIKDDDILMTHIKNLSDQNDKQQATIANRILWKVEGESEFISNQEKQLKRNRIKKNTAFEEKKAVYQYIRGDHRFALIDQEPPEIFDIMISYCQTDKDIPDKIYNRLIASNFYRVSFDKDNIHSSNPKAMAKAIEQSTIVIICFSAEYRQSYACRLEVEYAQKRERPIIPIQVADRQYNPTGWLKEIIGIEKPIDFTKSEFNMAYAQLIEKINEVNQTIDNN